MNKLEKFQVLSVWLIFVCIKLPHFLLTLKCKLNCRVPTYKRQQIPLKFLIPGAFKKIWFRKNCFVRFEIPNSKGRSHFFSCTVSPRYTMYFYILRLRPTKRMIIFEFFSTTFEARIIFLRQMGQYQKNCLKPKTNPTLQNLTTATLRKSALKLIFSQIWYLRA